MFHWRNRYPLLPPPSAAINRLRASGSGRDDPHPAPPPRARRGRHDNVDVAPERGQEAHQTLGRKAGQPAVQQVRDFGLIDLEPPGGRLLGEAPRPDQPGQRTRQGGLGQPLLRLGEAEIGEDIAAAPEHFFFAHVWRGVVMPLVAFF